MLIEFISGLIQMAEISSNANTKSVNLFSLLKILETTTTNVFRVYYFWNCLEAHFKSLAKSQFAPLRSLSITAMTCLIISVFSYRRGGSWRNTELYNWQEDRWQAVVLGAYKEVLHEESVYDVVSNLCPLVENAYAQMSQEGWQAVLSTLENAFRLVSADKLSLAYFKECTKEVFKCLEYIYNTSLHKMSLANIESMINIIDYFAGLKEDLSVSLMAVSFLHSIADYMAQQVQSAGPGKEKVSELWTHLFSKLKHIGTDERRELRSAGFKTLEQIMTNHGTSLSTTVWYYALVDIPNQFLEFLRVNYISRVRSKDEQTKDASNSEGENIEDVDLDVGEEGAWEESITMFYSSFVRIFAAFCSHEEATTM